MTHDVCVHEREITRLSRLFAALSHINHAVASTSARDELFEQVCRALVEHGGFRTAWIGWPAGFRSGRARISNDTLSDPAMLPWRSDLERQGLRSLAVLPIRLGGEVCGTLCVYAEEPEAFRDKELALLEETVAILSLALDNFARDAAFRLAEQRVHDERLFSDTMIESMPGILFICDEQGRFLRWNRSLEVASGYSGAQIARMHPRDFFLEEAKPRVGKRIAEVFESGEASVEALLVANDGTVVPYFFRARRVMFEGNSRLVGVGIDISDRRRAEARLAESERKYRELVEHANSIILRWNAEGRITFLNEFGQRFFGYSSEEILGRHVLETIVPPTESSGRDLGRLMEDILEAPEPFEQNVNENMRRNGERVWIAWTNRIVRDAQGKVVELLSIGTDITERRRAEAAVREAELRFHTLFEQTPVGVVVVDPTTAAILECNEQAAQQLGYTSEEFSALTIPDIQAANPRPDAHDHLARILGEGRDEFETQHRTKSGEVRDVFVSARALELAGRVVIHCVFLDVTERKRAETERERRQRAEAADRIKSAFLATMSHELRTPLNSIIGFTGIVLQGLAGPLNPEQTKQLGMVRSSARHLLELINDVLDISKIEAGQLEVRTEPFDLHEVVERVAASVRPMAEKKDLTLTTHLPSELREMVSDRRRVEQVLLNLLNNALKFTDQGGVTLTVEAVAGFRSSPQAPPRPAVRMRVADTGIGIKPEDLELLFQPFRQLDTGLTRQHDGTGLGLAICRRLAGLLGGEISASSTWQRGSEFVVTLPLRNAV